MIPCNFHNNEFILSKNTAGAHFNYYDMCYRLSLFIKNSDYLSLEEEREEVPEESSKVNCIRRLEFNITRKLKYDTLETISNSFIDSDKSCSKYISRLTSKVLSGKALFNYSSKIEKKEIYDGKNNQLIESTKKLLYY